MNREKVQNFINKGYIINKNSVFQQLLCNIAILALTILLLLTINDYISIIICFALNFFIAIIIVLAKKAYSFSKRFIMYSLSMLTLLIDINYLIYVASFKLNTSVIQTLIASLSIQVILTIVFLIVLKNIADGNKKYIAVPYASSGLGFIIFIIFKYSFKYISVEYTHIIGILVLYIIAGITLYYAVNNALKFYYSNKYGINSYNA